MPKYMYTGSGPCRYGSRPLVAGDFVEASSKPGKNFIEVPEMPPKVLVETPQQEQPKPEPKRRSTPNAAPSAEEK